MSIYIRTTHLGRDRAGHWAGGMGETVMLEIGQVGRYEYRFTVRISLVGRK